MVNFIHGILLVYGLNNNEYKKRNNSLYQEEIEPQHH